MKKTILITWFLLIYSSVIFSQEEEKSKPKKIYGIAKENKPVFYYANQSRLWKNLIEKDPHYAEGWNNYYRAERAKLQLEKPDLWSNNKLDFYQRLSPIIVEAKKFIGNTFDYYWIKGYNSSGQTHIDALKQAYLIDSERDEVYGELLVHYIKYLNAKECVNFGKRILANNIYSDANLKWNYNALISVEKNGVIISSGDIDGIPKWVLQYGANVRKDVMVTNAWLLAENEEYRKKTYSKIGMSLPKLKASDFKNMMSYVDYLASDILKRSPKATYISSDMPTQFFKENGLEGKMYLVGNLLKYSNNKFDNTPFLIDNFENKYYLEHIFKNFQNHQENELVKTYLNSSYLPGLRHLKIHYQSNGNTIKEKYYTSLIDKIVLDSAKKEEIFNNN